MLITAVTIKKNCVSTTLRYDRYAIFTKSFLILTIQRLCTMIYVCLEQISTVFFLSRHKRICKITEVSILEKNWI